MSESILERLRFYARVDPRNTVSVFPGDVIEAVDELLRSLSIGRILDMMKAAPYMEEETMYPSDIVKRIESICEEFDSRVEDVGLVTARLELAKALANAESAQHPFQTDVAESNAPDDSNWSDRDLLGTFDEPT